MAFLHLNLWILLLERHNLIDLVLLGQTGDLTLGPLLSILNAFLDCKQAIGSHIASTLNFKYEVLGVHRYGVEGGS